MLPIYFVIGILNIFSQHHNYGIKINDPNFDVRVRRSVVEDTKEPVINLRYNEENLKRDKRYAYYKKTRITDNDIPRNNNENNNGTAKNNRYDIFNPNWNFLFNTTNNRNNNSGINNPINNRPMIINSYPYGYPPGYAPKTNSGTGSNQMASTAGYQNNNGPVYYNYQNPDGKNFAGFAGQSANTPRLVTTPLPYAPSYTQKPLTDIFNSNIPTASNIPTSYTTTSNSGIHNLPYGTNPVNGAYNSNFNSIPKPFVKDNLSPYAPNFDNGSTNFTTGSTNFTTASTNFTNGSVDFNNGSVDFNNGSVNFNNGSYALVNSTNTTATTTEKILGGCVIACSLTCPKFMKRFGRFCVDSDSTEDEY